VIEILTTERMVAPGTNSPSSADIDSVIETLTTERMIPSGTNSPPSAGIASVIETLITVPSLSRYQLMVDY
jgi:hypothetical protein